MERFLNKIIDRVTPHAKPQVRARHAEWSVVSSADDLSPRPTEGLLDQCIRAISDASTTPLRQLPARCSGVSRTWSDVWPGEHYRLLPALVRAAEAEHVAEIGTFTGMGTIALSEAPAHVTSYDLVPWEDFPDTVLIPSDFEGTIEQRIGDLSDPVYFAAQRDILETADVVFVDGPKDGEFEIAFTSLLLQHFKGSDKLLVFDDIRLMPMVQFWRDLDCPKQDLTSFGHWSGTGVALL